MKLASPAIAGACLFLALPSPAATFQEDFSSPPVPAGWQTFGDASLFQWDATNKNLRVTWDSSQTNSYFYHPLGTVVTRDDDFTLAFDLRLDDLQVGVNPNKPYAFQIAIGFLNLANATSPDFRRGTGVNATNLIEFTYFGDAGFGATVWPIFISTNGGFNYNGPDDYTICELTNGVDYRVTLSYTASDRVIKAALLTGQTSIPINDVPLNAAFGDFRVDTFSITSYSDAGDDWDSVLAHGVVDNVNLTVPEPPLATLSGGFSGQSWQVTFASNTNWIYTLERTADFSAWVPRQTADGNGTTLSLQDTNPPPLGAFYRVGAQRR